MVSELNFSERMAVIDMTNHFINLINVGLRTNKHEYLNKKILQSILDKTGGNPELNMKNYLKKKQGPKLNLVGDNPGGKETVG